MVPPYAHGIQVMSIGFLVPDGEALVWRGPMLHKAIQQLLTDVAWGDPKAKSADDRDLDYLIVDLPPGTGDAQMSLAQLVPLTGAVIVTTPQNVALADATRGITAFNRLEVPVLGLIENMAGEVFGVGGGEAAAHKLGIPFLGRVELATVVRESGDKGEPVVACCPQTDQAEVFRQIAQRIAANVSVLNARRPAPGSVPISLQM
jgi:ATP-binding protein involved in chromosome partitioning